MTLHKWTARGASTCGVLRTPRGVLLPMALLAALAACGNTQQGYNGWSGGYNTYQMPDLSGGGGDMGATKPDAASATGDGANGTGSETQGTADAAGGDDQDPATDALGQDGQAPDVLIEDDGAVGEDGAVPEDVAPEDDSEGTDSDADPLEDTEEVPDVPVVQDTKKPKDNGEDPNNPWYTQPLDDAYIAADLPDAVGDPDTGAQSMPPLCTPQTGAVSVTETVGPGGKLDIIVWVDTSGSMVQEAAWVSTNLSKFAGFVKNKNIDFHLILVGITQGSVKLCVGAPLGNPATCDTADPNVFKVVKKPIQSTDGLSKLITYYNDYKAFLRPDAVKNIIAVTDDNSSLSAVNFTTQWANLQPAGSPKTFIYHGIVSYNNDANPAASTSKCSTGATLSKVHLDLAKQTGGYLFQLCKPDWTPAFDSLAQAVAATAKPVCTYKLPIPASKAFKSAEVKVSHIENNVVVPLKKIFSADGCATVPDGWYYNCEANPTTVTLCPDKCKDLVGGALMFNFGCAMSVAADAGSTDVSCGD